VHRSRLRSRPHPLPAETRRALEPDGVLALQRTAGNRAVTRALQRQVIAGQEGHGRTVRFTVGTEIAAAFAQKAKQLAADGKVSARDLEQLRTEALAGDETVDDDERMFMAALLDARNVAVLKKQPLAAAGDAIDFPEPTITPAARARIADLDRPALSAGVQKEERARDRAAKANDGPGWGKHVQALDRTAKAEVLRLAGSAFAAAAQATLALGVHSGVGPETVLRAMIAAASDSTPGDLALAGAVYVIAVASGSPVAGDVLAGRIKVDQVPRSELKGGEWAAYQAAGSGAKGDTVYLPTDFDPANLGHRGAVVHELAHAKDDKAAGTAVVAAARDQNELRAYRVQARFLLDTIAPLSGDERTNAVDEAATQWQPLTAYAMALEARSDVATFGPILGAVNQAATVGAISRRDLTAALNMRMADVEAFALRLIRGAYKMPADPKILQDGLSGESILDWITRLPSAP
jgi:hypothetical protein